MHTLPLMLIKRKSKITLAFFKTLILPNNFDLPSIHTLTSSFYLKKVSFQGIQIKSIAILFTHYVQVPLFSDKKMEKCVLISHIYLGYLLTLGIISFEL
jgi:hypothetical protein